MLELFHNPSERISRCDQGVLDLVGCHLSAEQRVEQCHPASCLKRIWAMQALTHCEFIDHETVV